MSSAGPKRSAAHEKRPRGLWRRLLYWGIVAEIVAVVAFIGVLVLGEHSRPTLILLYLPRLPLLAAVLGGGVLAPLARHRSRILLAIEGVLLLVVLFPVMGLAVSVPRSLDHPIHLATYNVFFGKAGRPALLDELAAMPADLLVVQAAFASLGERLHERLPDRVVRQQGELLLVSKFPVRTVEASPPLPDGTPSMFVKFVVDTPSGGLRVYDVHAYSPRHALFGDHETGDDIAHRDGQIGGVVMAARSDVPPFIISGDTNLPALSAIARRHFAGLSDAFADVGFGFGYTFPTKRPWMRIDRVLGSDGVRFGAVRVGPRGASDHRPLFVDFEVTSGG